MTDLRVLRNRLLDSNAFRGICGHLGIDSYQYRVLLDLFGTLSDRLEVMGSTVGLVKVAAVYAAFSVLISLTALGNPPLQNYLAFMLGYSMLLLLWILLEDAANSIMNPDEASVLAHQPIRGATYVAAKLTHLLVIVTIFIPALNAIPALAGLLLSGARWFYPLAHLIAAYLAGLFIAFLICGIYGWFFRFIPPAKLKNAALWLPWTVMLAMPMINLRLFLPNKAFDHAMAKAIGSSWMPWRWFVALGLTGHGGYAGFSAWEAAAACFLTLVLIALGLQGFREDYLVSASTLVQGSATPVVRPSRRARLNPLVRKLTGAPSGYGAFAFTGCMLRRDWNFRRQALPMMVMYFIYTLGAAVSGLAALPFSAGRFTMSHFSPSHLIPHFLGAICLAACALIAYTAEPHGSDMFMVLPMGRLRPFVCGVYLSLWMPIVGVTHLCLAGPCIWYWGITQAALFIVFSAALTSFYLSLTLFLVAGLPFANRFKPSMGSTMPLAMIIGFIVAVIFGGIQWLVFQNAMLVCAAAVLFAVLAWIAAHFSLGKVEEEIRKNLKVLGFGPQQMFKELD